MENWHVKFIIKHKDMVLYLIIQTVVLSIVSMFFTLADITGQYSVEEKRRRIYYSIGISITLIFAIDVFAFITWHTCHR